MEPIIVVCAIINLIAGAMWLTGWALKKKYPSLKEWTK